ncbi:MAG: TonB family protein [Ignavibacteria bacterium]
MKKIPVIFVIVLSVNLIYCQNGVMKSYFMDGSVKSEQTYIKDVLDGPSVFYYPNGNIKTIINYSEGKVNGWVRNYYDTGLLESEYFVNKGVRDGSTRYYYENGGLKSVIVYKRGVFVSRNNITFDSNFVPSADDYAVGNKQYAKLKNDDRILCDVEICPAPIGGIEAIQNNIVYPEKARLYGLEGIVTVAATISAKGEILESKVIKGLGLGLDEAAIDAVKSTRFLPGKSNNESVASNITIRVKFDLDEKQLMSSAEKVNREIPDVGEYDAIEESLQEDNETEYKPKIVESKNENIEKELPVTATEILPQKDDDIKSNADNLEYNIHINNYSNFDCDAQVCPTPIGGPGKIKENLVIPQVAFKKDVVGDVVIIAKIDKYGFVRNTRVVQGLGYGIDEAAEVAVLDTEFNPAKENGVPVPCEMIVVVPVRK